MNSLKKLYNAVRNKLTTQLTYDAQNIIEPLSRVHEPTFSGYAIVEKALATAEEYMRSESFAQKSELLREMAATEYLRPFEEREIAECGTRVFGESYELLAVHSDEAFFDYINASLLGVLADEPSNVDAPQLLLEAVELKLSSNVVSAYSRLRVPLTISGDILLRVITYAAVSPRTRILLLRNAFLFDKEAVLVQLHAVFKAQIAALIEAVTPADDVFETVMETLTLYCAYEHNEAEMGRNMLLYIIQPIAKLIRQICFSGPECDEHEFAAHMLNLSAEILHFVRQQQKLRVFSILCVEMFPQRAVEAEDISCLTEYEQMLLSVFESTFESNTGICWQLALRNAALSVLVEIMSGAHNRCGALSCYEDCLIAEAVAGITVRAPCRSFRLAADALCSRELQRIAQIAASIPAERMLADTPTNIVVYYALQACIEAFDVLQYNDYCGDDCAYTADDTGRSYHFEVVGDAITQLLYFFTNYRLFSAHLLLLNPHFKEQIQHIDDLLHAALTKMTPHVAMLKANNAGFFEKVDFVRVFERIVELTDDMHAERAAVFTGFLLGRIKSADPRWADYSGARRDPAVELLIAQDRGVVIADEEEPQPENAADTVEHEIVVNPDQQ